MAAAKGNNYAQKYTPQMIKELCDSLLDFAENERCAHFARWARKQKKSSQWMYMLAEDYPEFEAAMEQARELMSCKLVTSSIYKDDPNFQPQYAMMYVGVYDKQFREHLKWKAEITKEQPQKEESKSAINEYIEQQKANK
jgi:hypothetical protein